MCRWVALPPMFPKDSSAIYNLLVQDGQYTTAQITQLAGDPRIDRGFGRAYVKDGKFELLKSRLGFDRDKKLMLPEVISHMPHNGWTIMHHRYGNANYGEAPENMHPWIYGDWCTLQNGRTSVTRQVAMSHKLSVKGMVDSEFTAAFIGKAGPESAELLCPTVSHSVTVSLCRTGELVVMSNGRGQFLHDESDHRSSFPIMATSITLTLKPTAGGYLVGDLNNQWAVPFHKGLSIFEGERKNVGRLSEGSRVVQGAAD